MDTESRVESRLIVGRAYDLTALRCMGWTEGDGSGCDGYNFADYFSDGGEYLGPDSHGIEPICEAR